MKIAAFIFAIALAPMAFAQTQVSTGKVSKPSNILEGAYIGLDYMNLTDLKTTTKVKTANVRATDYEGGMSVGVAGLRAGYDKQISTSPWRVGGGLRYNEAFNEGEEGKIDLQLLILEANGKYVVNSWFTGYAGLNVSSFTGSSELAKYASPGGGLQAGFLITPVKHFQIAAGYTMLTQEIKVEGSNSTSSYEWTSEYRISGFTTSLNYVF
jgi:hypothetical protein